MSQRVSGLVVVGVVACLALTGCAKRPSSTTTASTAASTPTQGQEVDLSGDQKKKGKMYSVGELFSKQANPAATVAVNKYIWQASLEVLNFLPVQSADPFSGLIVTGYGTPPGGRTAYRATILVSDPAMDARSLNISLMTHAGPVDEKTRAAVEDAILTRARQLRVADLKL